MNKERVDWSEGDAGADGTVTVEAAANLTVEAAIAPRNPNSARLSLLNPDRAHDGRYASLSISDTGPGMERE